MPQVPLLRIVVLLHFVSEIAGRVPDASQQLFLPAAVDLVHQQEVHLRPNAGATVIGVVHARPRPTLRMQ